MNASRVFPVLRTWTQSKKNVFAILLLNIYYCVNSDGKVFFFQVTCDRASASQYETIDQVFTPIRRNDTTNQIQELGETITMPRKSSVTPDPGVGSETVRVNQIVSTVWFNEASLYRESGVESHRRRLPRRQTHSPPIRLVQTKVGTGSS